MRLHNIQLFRSLIMGNRKRLTLHKWKKENTRKIPVHELRNLRTTFHSSEKEKNFRFERKIFQEEKNNNKKENIHIWERVMLTDGFSFVFWVNIFQKTFFRIWIYYRLIKKNPENFPHYFETYQRTRKSRKFFIHWTSIIESAVLKHTNISHSRKIHHWQHSNSHPPTWQIHFAAIQLKFNTSICII